MPLQFKRARPELPLNVTVRAWHATSSISVPVMLHLWSLNTHLDWTFNACLLYRNWKEINTQARKYSVHTFFISSISSHLVLTIIFAANNLIMTLESGPPTHSPTWKKPSHNTAHWQSFPTQRHPITKHNNSKLACAKSMPSSWVIEIVGDLLSAVNGHYSRAPQSLKTH